MRLIDADKIFRRVKESTASKEVKCLAECLVATAPPVDAVVVTRCKDCKYADGKKETSAEKRYVADILFCRNSELCGDEPLAMWPNDFCSYGEPKDG